ncbi:hypothetical protein [Olleya sp. R77988]|uniref:hypothetical protein n=1 Tax=Olleya sp. R77988 TaxID=3093875 RepID=UPI0037C82167
MKIGIYIISFTLTALLLFNSTRASLTYAYYKIDPIGFIEALCENQDKPELECNGKCQLKKVANSQDKEQKTPESILDFKELILFTESVSTITFNNKKSIKKQNLIAYQNLYSFNNNSDCFHPPQV